MATTRTQKTQVPIERRSRFSTAVDEEAMAFIKAIETYKEAKARPFPSWTEVLQIVRALGYRLVAEPEPLPDAPKPAIDPDDED